MADLPRVLVVSASPFGISTGTGITLTNLFDGWPTDRLAQIYLTGEPGQQVCSRFFHYAYKNAPVEHAVRSLMGLRASSRASTAVTVPTGEESARHRQMRAIADLSPTFVPQDLKTWIRDFRPDLVYSLLGSVRVMRLAHTAAEVAGCRLVPHFMDDWPATLYGNGEFLGLGRRGVRANLSRVLQRAALGLAISEQMAREFEHRYGVPFRAFANCVEESSFASDASSASEPGQAEFELVYVGGLHLGRAESLAEIGTAVQSLRLRGLAVALSIYVPAADLGRHSATLEGLDGVRLKGSLNQNEVADVLRTAGALVHIESFDEATSRYTRLSLSTKIPQYLAAGRPVIGYGPSSLASMQHITTSGGGLIVSERGQAALQDALSALCTHPELRNSLGNAGFEFAKAHHSKPSVVRSFRDALRSGVGSRVM